MNVVPEFDQGNVRSTLLWQRWQGLRSTAHRLGTPKTSQKQMTHGTIGW